MKYFKRDDTWVVILGTGEELMDSLAKLAADNGLAAAWLSGLGAASVAELGYYDLPGRKYYWKTLAGKMEITNLTGNLSQKDGQPFWHVHGTFTDEDFRAVGGHIKKMVVGPTCELLIRRLDQKLHRLDDRASGLSLLDGGE